MTNEVLKTALAALLPSVVFDETSEWITISVDPDDWKAVALQLRTIPSFYFDYLFCLTCIDWKTHFTIVMHLTSTTIRHSLVVKTKLDRNDPFIESVSDTWITAEFHEREIYDLFGVRFLGHPDLRRLFMSDDWNGWPLRKDYEDAVNMIRL